MAKGRRGSYSNDTLYEIIRLTTVEDMSVRQVADLIGSAKSTVNDFLLRKTYTDFWEEYDKKPHASAMTIKPERRRGALKGKRFVFTCAQNNTYVHRRFMSSLRHFLAHRDAELVVGCSYYNKNGFQNISRDSDEAEDEIWFDPEIREYIKEEPLYVTGSLLWLGDLNILPTAVRPLSGFHNYTKKESGIIPHCKVNMESMPTHPSDPMKFLYTTGSITYPNFIQKKAGQKAEFHHIFGALYVEVDEEGNWFARQLQAESDTGNFYDLEEYFTPDGVENQAGISVEAINWGDLHVEKLDPIVSLTSFGVKVKKRGTEFIYEKDANSDSMLDVLKPRQQFCHDTSDFTPRNHHNINDPHFRYEMFAKKQDTVEGALKQCANCLSAMTRDFVKTVVVESNHDLALMRWLKTADYKTDPANALFFLKTQSKIYEEIHNQLSKSDDEEEFNIFSHVMTELDPTIKDDSVIFLNTDQSWRLFGPDGIECGWHGHNGNNGARGSTSGFTKVGIRVNIGHQHTAGIHEGVYVAGVSGKLKMGYNKGPSSWSHSHIITYSNGKRAIVTLKNGKWRA